MHFIGAALLCLSLWFGRYVSTKSRYSRRPVNLTVKNRQLYGLKEDDIFEGRTTQQIIVENYRLQDLLQLQLQVLASAIQADSCHIYISSKESSTMISLCEFYSVSLESSKQHTDLKLTDLSNILSTSQSSKMAVANLPLHDGLLVARISYPPPLTSSAHQSSDSNSSANKLCQSTVSQLMQLTARSVSLILNAEQALTESRLWQEKMESYVQFIETDRFAASSMTRNAVQAILTLIGLLRPRLPQNDELSAELLDNISVQVDSIASTMLSPQLLEEEEDVGFEGIEDNGGLGLDGRAAGFIGHPPSQQQQQQLPQQQQGEKDGRPRGSYDAEIWRPVKEESLLDLKPIDTDAAES